MAGHLFSKKEVYSTIKPLAEELILSHQKGKTAIIGIQGGQGTGKTSISIFLKDYLAKQGYKIIAFSIDDFYKSYEERKKLREKYPDNPFYQISRGLPGTHRVSHLKKILKRLKQGQDTEIPVFDKSLHDARGDISKKTIKVKGRKDFVIFEGWCLGLPAVSTKKLAEVSKKNKIPLRSIDPQLRYAKVVLDLAKEYRSLWKFLDITVMLIPDSSELHQKWRYKQERQLKQKTGKGMSKEQVNHFVSLYLPFTYLCYELFHPEFKMMIDKNHVFYRLIRVKSKNKKNKNNLNL